MNILKLMSLSRKDQAEVVAGIDAAQVKGRGMRRKLEQMKKKQGGFTLLELLVVVAIIAAIAGTATILLRDTDRQASAAAHVAMMDELMKGISTFQVLNGGKFPDSFDSLQATAGAGALTGALPANDFINADLSGNFGTHALTADTLALLNDFGVTTVRVLDTTADPNGAATGDCGANNKALINNKGSDVTASTMFRSAAANGCGIDRVLAVADVMHTWDAAQAERVNADTAQVGVSQFLIALGVGPDTSLFNPELRGAMTTVPTYRHVAADEYNRFTALLNVDTDLSEVRLQAIIDGAGDTKDEELGEWDGTRATI